MKRSATFSTRPLPQKKALLVAPFAFQGVRAAAAVAVAAARPGAPP